MAIRLVITYKKAFKIFYEGNQFWLSGVLIVVPKYDECCQQFCAWPINTRGHIPLPSLNRISLNIISQFYYFSGMIKLYSIRAWNKTYIFTIHQILTLIILVCNKGTLNGLWLYRLVVFISNMLSCVYSRARHSERWRTRKYHSLKIREKSKIIF